MTPESVKAIIDKLEMPDLQVALQSLTNRIERDRDVRVAWVQISNTALNAREREAVVDHAIADLRRRLLEKRA